MSRPVHPTWPIPELAKVDIIFPAHALKWMPPMEVIPDEFKGMDGETEWNRIVRQWFFFGLPEDVEFYPRKGIDSEAAFNAIQATLGSYAPKHQHKEAAAAYMLFCWFKKVRKWKK